MTIKTTAAAESAAVVTAESRLADEYAARAAARLARIDAAREKADHLAAALESANAALMGVVGLDFEAAEAAEAIRDDYARRAKNAAAAFKRVQTIAAREAADDAAALAAALDSIRAAEYDATREAREAADREAARRAADGRKAAIAVEAAAVENDAKRAAIRRDADRAAAVFTDRAAAVEAARADARAADERARLARNADEYAAAIADGEAAREKADALIIAAREAAADARAALTENETADERTARIDRRIADAEFDRAALADAAKRAARADAKRAATLAAAADADRREAVNMTGADIPAIQRWQVAFYPLDAAAVLKGIRRREAGAGKLMNDALESVRMYADTVSAASAAAAVLAVLASMNGDEFDGVGASESAALAAAVEAARAADNNRAAYENAAAVLRMVVRVSVNPVAAADDAAALYAGAVSAVQASTRRAYTAIKGAKHNAAAYIAVKGDRCPRFTLTAAGLRRARRQPVSASKESVLNEMYSVSRQFGVMLRGDTLVPDMIHDAIIADLVARRDGVTDARAVALTRYAAINAVLDGEGVKTTRRDMPVSFDALTAAGWNPIDRAALADGRDIYAALRAMINECRPLMTARQREVMQLTVFARNADGAPLTVAQIAARVGVKSKGTVNDIQNKARGILAEYVLAHKDDFSPAVLRACRAIVEAADRKRALNAEKNAALRARKNIAAK